MRIFIPLMAATFLALPAAAQPASPASDEEKYVYLMGASMGRNIKMFDLNEREVALVKQGLEDALLDRDLQVDIAEYGPKMNEFVEQRNLRTASREKSSSDEFLAKAEKTKGAIKTSSGLIFSETKAGTGPAPTATDNVKVHYHGTRTDGSVFDSSRDRGEPVVFPLNGVIVCWTEALQRMKVGGEATIACPADLAYGDRGIPGTIKPGAALSFEVELLSIE
jgi:FKBP-type peptidyl-prolyl cis-trans isomerase